jgi:hypothetical protein
VQILSGVPFFIMNEESEQLHPHDIVLYTGGLHDYHRFKNCEMALTSLDDNSIKMDMVRIGGTYEVIEQFFCNDHKCEKVRVKGIRHPLIRSVFKLVKRAEEVERERKQTMDFIDSISDTI